MQRVNDINNPELKWDSTPPGFSYPYELQQSDAYAELSSGDIRVLNFVLSCRQYKGKKSRQRDKEKYNVWEFKNMDYVKISLPAFREFYSRQQRSKRKPLSKSTYDRAMIKLMAVGFISKVYQGGNGIGDVNAYRYEFAWRLWRKGDEPCFTSNGMSKGNKIKRADSGQFIKKRY